MVSGKTNLILALIVALPSLWRVSGHDLFDQLMENALNATAQLIFDTSDDSNHFREMVTPMRAEDAIARVKQTRHEKDVQIGKKK